MKVNTVQCIIRTVFYWQLLFNRHLYIFKRWLLFCILPSKLHNQAGITYGWKEHTCSASFSQGSDHSRRSREAALSCLLPIFMIQKC